MSAPPTADRAVPRARPIARRRAPVRWPWVLVAAAWALAFAASLTGRRALIDHSYLLVQSRLPWLLALAVFLACWQVMTLAMMLPSSLPMVFMLIHASRTQPRTRAVQMIFLAGYALVWSGFAVVAFASDTAIHRLVTEWSWLAARPWLHGRAGLARAPSGAAAGMGVTGSWSLSPCR